MSDQQILPCVMCDQHHQQMLMLSCMHDPCINCAAMQYCTNQVPGSKMYVCAKCQDETQLDSSSVVELQRVYQQLKSKKKYDYRRNLGGFSHGQTQNQSYPYLHSEKSSASRYSHKKKIQTDDHYNNSTSVNPTYAAPLSQPYTPISQPSYPNNPYNNIIARKATQGTYMCQTHPQQELSYFCFDCSNPICPECAIHGTHRQHEVQTTRKSIKIIRTNLQECTDNLSQQTTATMNIKENYKNKIRDMTQQNKRDKDLVKDYFTNLKNILMEKQKQFQRVLDSNFQHNAHIIRNNITECQKVIENYGNVRKNIDSTLKKDELTILQEYSKREKQAKGSIESNKSKPYQSEPEGLKDVDYGLFKDEMDQLSGITQALRLTVKSQRN